MKILSDEQLRQFEKDCNRVTNANWDGSVKVEQDQDGKLFLTFFNDEKETECVLTATPLVLPMANVEGGEALMGLSHCIGGILYRLAVVGEGESGACCTLVPKLFVGYAVL